MGALAIAELMLNLAMTYGPKAWDIYNTWKNGLAGKEPTDADWASLQKMIDDHNPDTY